MTFAYPGYEQYHHYDGHDLHGYEGGFGGSEGEEADYGHHQIASQRIGHEHEHAHEYHHEEDEHVDYYVSFLFNFQMGNFFNEFVVRFLYGKNISYTINRAVLVAVIRSLLLRKASNYTLRISYTVNNFVRLVQKSTTIINMKK